MYIRLKNLGINFPIYDVKQRSLRQTLFSLTTTRIQADSRGIARVKALEDINLTINQNDRIVLLGHNGSGKTTLLKVIAGIYEPDVGQIEVSGQVTSILDPMMGLDLDATGYENIHLKGLFLGLKKRQIKNIIPWIEEFSELENFLNVPVRTYSSGMMLRLAFSTMTAVQPEILLLDEWLNVGDIAFREKAEKRLNEIIDNSGIVIIGSHDMTIANRLKATIIHLSQGKILS